MSWFHFTEWYDAAAFVIISLCVLSEALGLLLSFCGIDHKKGERE